MIKYPKEGEALVSALNILFVVITFLWKTVGLGWVPFGLGPAWEQKVLAEDGYFWPRHDRQEAQYLWFHIMLYCVGGTVAQISSWNLVQRPFHQTAQTLFGGFHVGIALYHSAVAFRFVRGKSILLEKAIWNDYPWIRMASQVLFTMELVVALNYLVGVSSTGRTRPADDHLQQQKISLDILSLLNFGPMTIFTLSIAFLDFQDEWIAFWVNAVCYGILPLLVLSLEFVRNWQLQRRMQQKMQ